MTENQKQNLNWKLIIAIMLAIVIASGGITFYLKYQSRAKPFAIDPEVMINPNKEYNISYWDYDLLIGQSEDYNQFLQQTIEEFSNIYPNIKITYQLLPFSTGEQKLRAAVELGTPPDIYDDIFSSRLISEELQIPVNLLFGEGDQARYKQLGISALTHDNKIWGLPNWLIPQIWVGNQRILNRAKIDLAKIKSQGWSWDEFYQSAIKVKDLDDKSYIVFNPYNTDIFYQLLDNIDENNLLSPDGGSFNRKSLVAIFTFLDRLRKEKVFPRKINKMNKRLIAGFWKGEAGIIAPVNIFLLNNLLKRDLKERYIDITLLPVPSNSTKHRAPIKVTSLLLFRQKEYQGDDHSKAVYQFAKFINQEKSLYLAEKLRVVPAYLPLQSIWQERVNLNNQLKEEMLSHVDRGIYGRITSNYSLEEELKDIIDKYYQEFWLKTLSVDRVVDDIINESQNYFNQDKTEKAEEN
ncbi:multiple sugar transport system substrate-binding protein [Orenia metallireducens]|uniref:Multiple sugar transport system substrate-binding protein n=1 Tax=Orenia metallireducens TaxID=1413210 RepID=A0A285F6U2_9FIRM|nr:ABC transporter substrate-binding protein [Orenia metallireducens]SNY05921.1 multiple sugar transport system substrate-binding protein [Orenia metallireducens]